jgi:hypothetical protein
MSETQQLIESQHQLLTEAMNDAFDALPYEHAELMHYEHARLREGQQKLTSWRPALTCLLTAHALGVSESVVLPAACALALIEASSALVDELVTTGEGGTPAEGSLMAAWGTARSLNAADGLFALAHSVLPWLREAGVPAATVLAVTDLVDRAVIEWCRDATASVSAGRPVPAGDSLPLRRCGALVAARLAGLSGQLAAAVATFVVADAGDAQALSQMGIEASTAEELAQVVRLIEGWRI